jgi:hypothetical protein
MKPHDVRLPMKSLASISTMPGDIGVYKKFELNQGLRYDSNRVRKMYYDEVEGAHPNRFEPLNSNLESISKHRRIPKVNISSYTKRGDLFEIKYN